MKSMAVAELIERYNKQNETKFERIVVSSPYENTPLVYFNVSNVTNKGSFLCFYGRDVNSSIKYVEVADGKTVRSEA